MNSEEIKLKKGLNIEGYELIEQIGQGGNGKVWKAKSSELEDFVAIKFLVDQSSKKVDRFKRECEFLENHKHKYIVEYFSSGKLEDGTLYHITRCYPYTFEHIFDTNKGWDYKISILIQLAEAISYLHENGIVHRDLKPENIFMDENKIVLGDFGIIKVKQSSLTKTRERMANAYYAAPEQLERNNTDNIGEKVDIYAFGKLINQCFTNKNLSGSNYREIEREFPFSFELDKLVKKMISYNPKDRPTAKSVYYNLKIIKNNIELELSNIAKIISKSNTEISLNNGEIKEISEDLYYSQMLYENATADQIKEFNPNWHLKYSYSVKGFLQNICFNEVAYDIAKRKFLYEGNVGVKHKPLDIKNNQADAKLHDEFIQLLEKYPLPNEYKYFINRTIKYFNSCCDYHAREIIECISHKWKLINYNITDAPILWLISELKNTIKINIDTVFGYELLINNIQLCQIRKSEGKEKYNPILTDSLRSREYTKKLNILENLCNSNLIESYIEYGNDEFQLVFRDNEQYNDFKNKCYASEFAEKYSGESKVSENKLVFIEDINEIFENPKCYEDFIILIVDYFAIGKINELKLK